MRIIVTGSRDWTDQRTLENAILDHWANAANRGHDLPVVVVHGAARGADRMAGKLARAWGKTYGDIEEERHPADWDRYGKSAGPVRNREMAKLGGDLCLAFTTLWPMERDGRPTGTGDMVNRCVKLGIPVNIFYRPLP